MRLFEIDAATQEEAFTLYTLFCLTELVECTAPHACAIRVSSAVAWADSKIRLWTEPPYEFFELSLCQSDNTEAAIRILESMPHGDRSRRLLVALFAQGLRHKPELLSSLVRGVYYVLDDFRGVPDEYTILTTAGRMADESEFENCQIPNKAIQKELMAVFNQHESIDTSMLHVDAIEVVECLSSANCPWD